MVYDVAVIGSGPAGLSAAINVRQRGRTVVCIGTDPDSNPLMKAEKIDNYLGLEGVTGREMMDIFLKHARGMGVEFLKERVLNTFYTGEEWMISAGPEVVQSLTLIFAGGIMRGKAYPGEETFLGRGVSYCATCDGMLYRGREVAVIGYGASDREEAEYLESIGCKVQYFERPRKVEILGEASADRVVIDGKEIAVNGIFVLRPTLAPSSLFPGLEMENGHIKTDRLMRTSLPGLYAAGDCTGLPLQVAKAVGEGLIAGQQAADEAAAKKREKE